MSRIPGKFVWFEHHSPDPAKAQAFYGPLLGWKIQLRCFSSREMHPASMAKVSAMGKRKKGQRFMTWTDQLGTK